jgi:hypothetical protein
MRNDAPKLSARDAIARSYPTWDPAMADRLIAWLDYCGYAVVEKDPDHSEATLAPAEEDASAHPQRAH